ncbi:MAG TPA: LuxR C-terminal-related transcriptional regulator [Flavobacterium sp.]
MRGFLLHNRQTILYASAMAALLSLLRWLELRFIIFSHSFEIYAGAIALIFTILGIWLATKLTKPKTETIIEKEIIRADAEFFFNEPECRRLNISKRELEVLTLIAQGLSNEEIASALFLSTNTVKTHAARLFEKLEAKRRTQAVEKAKQHGLLPSIGRQKV